MCGTEKEAESISVLDMCSNIVRALIDSVCRHVVGEAQVIDVSGSTPEQNTVCRPIVGKRYALRDCHGLVWGLLEKVVLFQPDFATWYAMKEEDFMREASLLGTTEVSSGDAVVRVLTENGRQPGAERGEGRQVTLPSAFLKDTLMDESSESDTETKLGWAAYSVYTPATQDNRHFAPPCPFELRSGDTVKLAPPLVPVATRARVAAPTPPPIPGKDGFVSGEVIAVVLGRVYNTSKCSVESNRFVLVRCQQGDYTGRLKHVKAVLPNAGGGVGTLNRELTVAACKAMAERRPSGISSGERTARLRQRVFDHGSGGQGGKEKSPSAPSSTSAPPSPGSGWQQFSAVVDTDEDLTGGIPVGLKGHGPKRLKRHTTPQVHFSPKLKRPPPNCQPTAASTQPAKFRVYH